MPIINTRFGYLEVSQKHTLACETPILGFENLQQFVLVDAADYRPFFWLQSIENPDLSFILADPGTFGLSYPLEKMAHQHQRSTENLHVMVMVILTANTAEPIRPHKLGPLWFDSRVKNFGQWVIDNGAITQGEVALSAAERGFDLPYLSV